MTWAKAAQMAAALLRYGQHKPGCSGLRDFECECDCGFYELKAKARELLAKRTP